MLVHRSMYFHHLIFGDRLVYVHKLVIIVYIVHDTIILALRERRASELKMNNIVIYKIESNIIIHIYNNEWFGEIKNNTIYEHITSKYHL